MFQKKKILLSLTIYRVNRFLILESTASISKDNCAWDVDLIFEGHMGGGRGPEMAGWPGGSVHGGGTK